ncbi:DUF6151 family protein [Roseofilum casamattae]|uniref:DUF6151 family protein n=1 Tax=Roseofilum casamattae BLCC-M143 TaxID=3022442 RepID=A0ABT7C3J2_9CYAN|nr:DUF6151 family protein [Roseofilum casamattae]MDJ1185153.1 DUF6151 family protein [Roseofilum casamattae BLCC-M143]
MSHPIQCRCGRLQGSVADVKTANRVVCYCQDCQAFAHFLGRSSEILDRYGGTDIVQTLPKHVSFTQGTEVLACMRLTETGLLRWYTSCCNTPIGNTLPSYKMSFVGLVHNCLESSDVTLDNSFGPVCSHVHAKYAKGEPKPKQVGFTAAIARNMARILKARIDGSYKQTPFFSADSEMPAASPTLLSDREYKEIMSAL